MADKYCPYCGELVPSNSLTCPKCYKKIPLEPEPRSTGGDNGSSGGSRTGSGSGGGTSDGIALLLAIIPGLFGILGLGILYKNRSARSWMAFLLLGLLVFAVTILIFTSSIPVLNILFAIPFAIVYGLLFIGALAVTIATKS